MRTIIRCASMTALAGGALVTVASATLSAQAQTIPAAARLSQARQLLENGSHREAIFLYSQLLEQVASSDNSARATSYFGRALASQQLLMNGDTVGVSFDGIRDDYRWAMRLDSARYRIAVLNNTALVTSHLDDHRAAAELFRAAAREASTNREAYLWSAGREYEVLSMVDSARSAYRQALAIAPASEDVRRSLLNLFARSFPAESLLAAAERLRTDTTAARALNDALLTLLARNEPAVGAAAARRALVTLASVWPALGVGPAYFNASLRDPLTRAVYLHSDLANGVDALGKAYEPLPPTTAFKEPATSDWWRRDRSPNGSYRAWSSILRSIGDSYYAQRAELPARSYYEAAIGWNQRTVLDPGVDRGALLPLAILYGREPDAGNSTRLQRDVDEWSTMLFVGKAAAYEKGDLEQIRMFHMTLGALYAQQKNWDGPGARNAEFQLEHMRTTSQRITQETGRKVVDPPDLLEKLGSFYEYKGKTREAAAVKDQLRRQYREAGRPDSGEAVVRRIDNVRVNPSRILRVRPDTVTTTTTEAKSLVPTSVSTGATVPSDTGKVSRPGATTLVPAVKPVVTKLVPRDTTKDSARTAVKKPTLPVRKPPV